MKATLSFTGGEAGASWRAETETGHALVVDGSPDIGGRDLGARPMELLLLGLGGCTAMDVLSILRKKRQRVADCRVELSAERAEEHPRVFTRIHVHFKVWGEVQAAAVERAIELSHTKYCSAYKMLSATAEISSSFEVVALEAEGLGS
jgi:putative redox protein